MMVINVPKICLTWVVALSHQSPQGTFNLCCCHTPSPKQTGEDGVVGNPIIFGSVVCSCCAAELLTDTGKVAQKGVSPSFSPLPPKAQSWKGPCRKQAWPVQPASPYNRAGLGAQRETSAHVWVRSHQHTNKQGGLCARKPHNSYLFSVLGNPNANGGLTEASNSQNKYERSEPCLRLTGVGYQHTNRSSWLIITLYLDLTTVPKSGTLIYPVTCLPTWIRQFSWWKNKIWCSVHKTAIRTLRMASDFFIQLSTQALIYPFYR